MDSSTTRHMHALSPKKNSLKREPNFLV